MTYRAKYAGANAGEAVKYAGDRANTGNCPLCTSDKPIYQLNNTCCRARFLVQQPTLAYRQNWLKRWEAELPAETMDEIKRLTIELWEAKRTPCNATNQNSGPNGNP